MTIMGKILVVLVLLLALFRGWLDVKYSVVKSNWKVAYDDADRELKAARANTAAALDENQRLKTRHDTLANDLAKLRKEFADFKLTSDKKLRDQQD